MLFRDSLMAKARPYVQAELQKPFLLGIAKGDLSVDRFQYWLKVDYQYLIHYAKTLALGLAKADSLETVRAISRLIDDTVNKEMVLHETYAARFGVSQGQLAGQKMGPIKYSYACHELAAAHRGSLGELIAALLPCEWGYAEIGRSLAQKPVDPANPFRDWLALYSSDEYGETASLYWGLLDRLAPTSSDSQLRQMEDNFVTSFQYEVLCWDEYYNKGQWTIC